MLSIRSSLLFVLALSLGTACERKDTTAPDDGKRPNKFGDGVEFDGLDDDYSKSAAIVTEFFTKFTSGDVEAAMELCTADLSLRVNGDEAVHEGRALVARYLRKLSGSIGLARIFVGEFGAVVAEGVRVKTSGGATGSGFVMIAEFDGDRIAQLTMVTRTLDGRTGDLPPAPTLPDSVAVASEMSNDLNKAVAENLYRTWTRRSWDDFQPVAASAVVSHDTARGKTTTGVDALAADFEEQVKAFPDLEFELKQSWAAGDFVAVEYEVTGTHTGSLDDIPATGATFKIPRVDVYRFADEAIVEFWSYYSPDLIRDRVREEQEKQIPAGEAGSDGE